MVGSLTYPSLPKGFKELKFDRKPPLLLFDVLTGSSRRDQLVHWERNCDSAAMLCFDVYGSLMLANADEPWDDIVKRLWREDYDVVLEAVVGLALGRDGG